MDYNIKFEVRTWTAEDREQTLEVLKDGSYSNIRNAYNIALKGKPFQFATVLICLTTYLITKSFVNFFFSMLLMMALLYCTQLMGTWYYLYGPPLRDMKNVEKEYIDKPDNNFWVAEMEYEGIKRVVGTIAVVKKKSATEKVAWLRRMVVHRECRGLGIGKQLVQTVTDFCRARDYDKIELITTEIHTAAQNLYRTMGFHCESVKPHRYLHGVVRIQTHLFVLYLK